MPPVPLERSFYARNPLEVARGLLGARLVRLLEGQRLAGLICEAEAYWGEEDLACHARAGLTPRTQVMYGPPGHSYVYFNYGVHWMLNVVTEPEGMPSAVLIRGIQPVEGLERMAAFRPMPAHRGDNRNDRQTVVGWTDGPGKVTRALGITGDLNGVDLCDPDGPLWIEAGVQLPDEAVRRGPRVGIHSVPEPWKSKNWRFLAEIPASEPPEKP
ncbi:MAG TPA: DNA-3-methyladenine glycosylase [Anaerolineaceae bacterium]|nr:DNA-3-methyladenine glycosylase [Anaerolineaceae bacterium]